jgi:hypothetical protein
LKRPPKRAPVSPLRAFLDDHGKLLLIVLAVFVLTTDDRHVGIVPDGRQMIWTAVAMTETGQLGQARGRDFTLPRAGGDAVSRFGMGMSIAQMPAAMLAPAVERTFGAAASQPLFLLAPLLFTILAAFFAGLAARSLDAGVAGQRAAILLTALGSPLAGYAAMEFSEPLQAAALAAAFAFALSDKPFAAGFAAGVAVLTKSVLIAVAPFALLPLLLRRDRVLRVAMGVSGPMALWLIFEIVRFGRPLAGYGGERFSHPFFDGFWRLLVSPNKGIVWFFPTLLVALFVALRRGAPPTSAANSAGGVAGAPLVFVALLAIASKWWAWHGAEGWGPRLLVPAVPLLAAVAAPLIGTWRQVARRAFIGVSVAANVLPLLQHPTPIATMINTCSWPVVDEKTASRIADYARIGNRVAPDGVLATVPTASPWLAYPWFMRSTWSSLHMTDPPWIARRPDIRPQLQPPPAVLEIVNPWSWRVLGRGFFPGERQAAYAAVYDEALLDQTIRAQQLGKRREALDLARKLESVAPTADSAVMIMESYRILGMMPAAQAYLSDVAVERRSDPRVNVVIALFERDRGNEASARRFLEDAARTYAPAALLLQKPIAAWPKTLVEVTEARVEGVAAR